MGFNGQPRDQSKLTHTVPTNSAEIFQLNHLGRLANYPNTRINLLTCHSAKLNFEKTLLTAMSY